MVTNLERYDILKKHLPEEAARVIAEVFPATDQVVTKDHLDARLNALETRITRWMLSFMATLWLGVGGMITAIVLKG